MKEKLHFNLFFLKMFLSFILIVFIPIAVFGITSYNNSIRNKKESFNQFYSLILKGMGEKVSDIMFMLENDMLSLKNDMTFFNFQRMNTPGENVDNILLVNQKLDEIKFKYKIINSVYFYDPTYDCIITNSSGSYDTEDFYDTQWLKEYDYKYAVKRYPTRRNFDHESFSHYNNILDFEPVYTIVFQLHRKQLLVVNVSTKDLMNYVKDVYTYNLQNYFIIDAHDTIVLQNNKNPQDPLGELKFSADINYNNWKIATYIPRAVLVNDLSYFKTYNIFIALLLLVICIIISYVLTKFIYSPIDHLIKDVKNFTHGSNISTYIENELQYFKNVFKRVLSENELLHSKISIYNASMKYHLFKDFIQTKITVQEFLEEAGQIDLDIINPYYQFIMISKPKDLLDHSSKTTLTKINLIEVVNTYLSTICKGIFFDIKQDFFITFISSNNREDLKNIQKNIIDIAQKSFNLGVYVGTSSIFEELENCPVAYTQSIDAINFGIFYKLRNEIISYDEIVSLQSCCPKIPINIEARLLKNIILCQKTEIAPIINQFMDHIQQNYNVPSARQVSIKLLSRIEKEFSFETIFKRNIYEDIDKINTLDNLENYMLTVFHTIVDYLSNAHEEENHYVTKAKEYLTVHFSKNISVTDVSDSLNISYPYLCKLFKDHTDMNMLDYLNTIRIEKSKELLKNTDNTIVSIAEKVGYNNYQSFQRFFKKIAQMTPGEFRKIHQP